jgi:hypothetical protein
MRRIGWTSFAAITLLAGVGAPDAQANIVNFTMLRSSTLPAGCAVYATAKVRVETQPAANNFAERMKVHVSGLAPHTALDIFVIQVPNTPFGVSWYVGDLETQANGEVTHTFVSRFNDETFAVAPGAVPAPTPHDGRDQSTNPAFGPIHTFHVGIWFDSPADALKNGATCPVGPTPFNGDHTAGGQVLSSHNASNTNNLHGPLRSVHD